MKLIKYDELKPISLKVGFPFSFVVDANKLLNIIIAIVLHVQVVHTVDNAVGWLSLFFIFYHVFYWSLFKCLADLLLFFYFKLPAIILFVSVRCFNLNLIFRLYTFFLYNLLLFLIFQNLIIFVILWLVIFQSQLFRLIWFNSQFFLFHQLSSIYFVEQTYLPCQFLQVSDASIINNRWNLRKICYFDFNACIDSILTFCLIIELLVEIGRIFMIRLNYKHNFIDYS